MCSSLLLLSIPYGKIKNASSTHNIQKNKITFVDKENQNAILSLSPYFDISGYCKKRKQPKPD
jgi:hypothetical protein